MLKRMCIFLVNVPVVYNRVLSELVDCELSQLLRLLSAKVLSAGERAEFCVIQTEHGTEAGSALSPSYGLPMHLRSSAGWMLWSATDQTQVHVL